MSQTENKLARLTKKSLLSPLKMIADQNQRYYNFSIQNEEKVLKITMKLYSKIKLLDAVTEALQEVGKENQLDNNPNNYVIYVSKKNGLPKTDFPSYQKDIYLDETGNNNFALVHITSETTKLIDKNIQQNQVKEQKQKKEEKQEKMHKNWFLNFFGCS